MIPGLGGPALWGSPWWIRYDPVMWYNDTTRITFGWSLWHQGTAYSCVPCGWILWQQGTAHLCKCITLPIFPTLRHRGTRRKYLVCVRQERITKHAPPYIFFSENKIWSVVSNIYFGDPCPLPQGARHLFYLSYLCFCFISLCWSISLFRFSLC